MSPSETVFLSSLQWATSRLGMKHKWTHSLARERTLTGDSRQQPTTWARSPVMLALSRTYLRQAHFRWNGATTADECKVNLQPKIQFKQRLITVSFFFMTTRSPVLAWQFFYYFPKIDIHFQSGHQVVPAACTTRSPARERRTREVADKAYPWRKVI